MAKIKDQIPAGKVKHLNGSGENLKNTSKIIKSEAEKSLIKLRLTEQEKIDSGEYEWIIITPKFGKPFRKLQKK